MVRQALGAGRCDAVPAQSAWLVLALCFGCGDSEQPADQGVKAPAEYDAAQSQVPPDEGTAMSTATAPPPGTLVEVPPLAAANPETQKVHTEPSDVPNDGVWIYAAGTISNVVTFIGLARGLGSEWEYLWTNALPSYGRVGIGGTGANDLWLVNTSATHFDGTVFAAAQNPWNLTGVHLGLEMGDVWANAANDVWAAVGPSGAILTELPLAHFDGASWRTVEEVADVLDVWASGPGDVWALSNRGEVHQYDGSQWQLHPVTGNALWGTGPDDVWVGMDWHYSAGAWVEIEVPAEAPESVRLWGSGPEDVWALDMRTGAPSYRFDGLSWVEQPSALSAGGGGLPLPKADIFGRDARDVWVVGSEVTPGQVPPGVSPGQGAPIVLGQHEGHVLHYDGEAWTDVTPPLLRGANLVRVWVAPSDD